MSLSDGLLIPCTPVSDHFNQADHSINDVLIPLRLIRSKTTWLCTASTLLVW